MSKRAISNAQLHPGTSRQTNLQRTQIMRWLKREKTDVQNVTYAYLGSILPRRIPPCLGCMPLQRDGLQPPRWWYLWIQNPCWQLSLSPEEGADPDAQDTYGNTVLHMVVIVEQLGGKTLKDSFISRLTLLLWPGMFGYALKHPIKKANHLVRNHRELTSLTLSCLLGRFQCSIFLRQGIQCPSECVPYMCSSNLFWLQLNILTCILVYTFPCSPRFVKASYLVFAPQTKIGFTFHCRRH